MFGKFIIAAAMAAIGLVSAAQAADRPGVDIYLAVPKERAGNPAAILRAGQQVFEGLRRDDAFGMINATNGQVVTAFSILDKGRYNRPKFVAKTFAAEKRSVQQHLWSMAQSASVTPDALISNVPAVLSAIGKLRQGRSRPAHVLLIGSPLHRDAKNGALSMLDDKGSVLIPSDGFLVGSLLLSPYGSGVERDTLKGVTVHFCAIQPKVSAFEEAEVGRLWAHYIDMRGGTLATFSGDLAVCLKRFSKRLMDALPVRPLDPKASPAMIRAGRSGAVTHIDLDESKAVAEQVRETRQTQERAFKKKRDALEYRAEEAEHNAAACKTKRIKAEAELGKMKAAMQSEDKLDGVTSFSRFQSVPHPTKPKLIVSTGVRYELAAFPAYANAWCYMNVPNRSGATVRLYLGDKNPGGKIRWSKPSAKILRDVQLSKQAVRDARKSCRFPKD